MILHEEQTDSQTHNLTPYEYSLYLSQKKDKRLEEANTLLTMREDEVFMPEGDWVVQVKTFSSQTCRRFGLIQPFPFTD